MPIFVGASLVVVAIDNANPLASIPPVVSAFLPPSVSNLTIVFENAPAVLPSISFAPPPASLSVTARGILQIPASTIVVPTTFFDAGAAMLTLANNNDFNVISVNNSGPNDVTIRDVDDLGFSLSNVIGSGRLTVNAGGDITGSGTIDRQPGATIGAPISFTSGGAITLDNNDNNFIGPVSGAASDANQCH